MTLPQVLTLRQVKDGTGFDPAAQFIQLTTEPLTERERDAVLAALEVPAKWPTAEGLILVSAMRKIEAGAQ